MSPAETASSSDCSRETNELVEQIGHGGSDENNEYLKPYSGEAVSDVEDLIEETESHPTGK